MFDQSWVNGRDCGAVSAFGAMVSVDKSAAHTISARTNLDFMKATSSMDEWRARRTGAHADIAA